MKNEQDLIAAIRTEYMEGKALNFDDALSDLSAHLESPIERVLLAALLLEEILPWYGVLNLPGHKEVMAFRDDDLIAHLECQANIGPYRADFYLCGWSGDNLAYRAIIECDGHDFHERSKEQARRDRQRDRWFQTKGIGVLRFAGSEIWADPSACAGQISKAFWEGMNRFSRGPRPHE